jgi:5-formyltetrahydrofolate cyclo-ligase
MTNDAVFEEKNRIRKQVCASKAMLSEAEKQLEAELVFAMVEKLPQFQQAKNILMYWSTADELPTHQFISKWQCVKQILLPCVVGDDIEIRCYNSDSALKKGNLGIWEPDTTQPFEGEIELAIVPGMAFDVHRNRTGRGKGYYDRFFSSVKSIKWGVCFECQLCNDVTTTDDDVKMDLVITPSRIIG